MGVDAGDYNGDGLPDLIVTNFSHDYNTLYENGPAGRLHRSQLRGRDRRDRRAVSRMGRQARRLRQRRTPRRLHRQRPRLSRGRRARPRHALSPAKQLFLNEGKRFRHATTDVGGGLLLENRAAAPRSATTTTTATSTCSSINMNDRPTLLRNDTPRGRHWITLRLVGDEEQPRRDRREGHRGSRRPATDGHRPRRWQLSLAQRRARTLRAGRGHEDQSRGDSLAERTGAERRGAGGGSVLCRCARGSHAVAGTLRRRRHGIFNTEATEITEAFDWSALRAAMNRVQPRSQVLLRTRPALVIGVALDSCGRPKAGTSRMLCLPGVAVDDALDSVAHRLATEIEHQA